MQRRSHLSVVLLTIALAIWMTTGLSRDAHGANQIIAAQLQAKKSSSPSTIEVSEWATVQLTVLGDTKKQTIPLPSAVVLVVDYSGSMGNNNAYQHASNAAKKALDLLLPGVDSFGLLRISTTADWLIPLAPLTASSIAIHKQVIDAQGAEGLTNYKEAFDKANASLASYTAANKFVIFLSDGLPEPDNVAQENYIYDHRYDPVASGIRYFTIAYGNNFSPLLLKEMAEATGGTFLLSNQSASGLQNAFKSAVDSGRYSLSARAVEIVEVVNRDLKIRPESFTWGAIPPTTEPLKFQASMTHLASTFHTTNTITIPKLNELALNQNFTLTFDVTSDKCLEGENLIVPIDDGKSEVRWLSASQSNKLTIPPGQLTVHPCDIHLEKDYDPATNNVTLTVRNDLPREISTVQVIEVTRDSFRPAPPFSPALDLMDLPHRQIRWGHFSQNKLSLNAKEQKTFTFHLSGETSQAGPLPINMSRAGVSYLVDAKLFAVPSTSNNYTVLAQDVQNRSLSQTGADALNAYMLANDFIFSVSQNTPVKKAPSSSEFSHIVEGTPQSRELKLKFSPSEVVVYTRVLKSKRFPQEHTPTGHVVPK